MRHFTAIYLMLGLGLMFSLQSVTVQAQCTDLFISEYVEGGGNNKCVEIYNPTSSSIDLAAGNYQIIRYSNGSTSGAAINLTGTIAAGGTYVVCNPSATSNFTALADQTSGSANWNGDDAIALSKNGTNIDIFGTIGQDPGSQWIVGGNHTKDRTLRRNADITSGNTSNDSGFPALGTEWTEYPKDTYDGLGSHTFDGCPTAGCDELYISEYIEGGGNNKCVEIFNPTASSIDLAAGNYQIVRYSNGSTSGVNINLTGTISGGGTYVLCNTSANSNFTSLANQLSGSANWNGDDAIALSKNGTNIDIFGTIGQDPGSQWIVGGNHTKDRTLRRNADVTGGNASNDPGFPALGTEWTEYPKDTYDGLGSHTSDCMPTPTGCSLDGITVMNDGACDDKGTIDPADDIFTATVHVDFSNLAAGGTLVIFGDGFYGAVYATDDLLGDSYVEYTETFRADAGTIVMKAQVYEGIEKESAILCDITETNAGTALPPCSAIPDCSEPFFSEYIEGSGNNKSVEIYNPTGADIDLAAEGYYIRIYFNGASNPGQTIALTGTIMAGGTYVVSNSNADGDIQLLTDQASGALTFNGDDAVVLGNTGNVLDIIGQVGFDPGSSWSSGGVGTQNMTMRRHADVLAGDNFGGDAFFPDAEWDAFPQNSYLGLGSHGSDCGGSGLPTGPWSALNVNCDQGNSSTYDANNDTWDITSNCPPDNIHTDIYAYLAQEACGDLSITVKIEGIVGLGKGGLMIRESIAPQSKYVWLTKRAGGGFRWEFRANDYEVPHYQGLPFYGASWMRVTRTGNYFKAYLSYNGVTWHQVAATPLSMSTCPLAGFAVETLNFSPSTFTISNLELDVVGNNALARSTEGGKVALIDKERGNQPELPAVNIAERSTDVAIYPNPARDWVNINIPSEWRTAGTLQIIDPTGKVLIEQRFSEDEQTIELQLSKLNIAKGMYIIRLQTSSQTINRQFIKQ